MLLCELLTELHLGVLQLVLPVHTFPSTHTLQADTLFHTKPTHAHHAANHTIKHTDHPQAPWVPELRSSQTGERDVVAV